MPCSPSPVTDPWTGTGSITGSRFNDPGSRSAWGTSAGSARTPIISASVSVVVSKIRVGEPSALRAQASSGQKVRSSSVLTTPRLGWALETNQVPAG